MSSRSERPVSFQDIHLVRNLIECCLQQCMSKEEVVNTLLTRAEIDPEFTKLVWRKLEEENEEFFRAYYSRLKLNQQIIQFNKLLEKQKKLMDMLLEKQKQLMDLEKLRRELDFRGIMV